MLLENLGRYRKRAVDRVGDDRDESLWAIACSPGHQVRDNSGIGLEEIYFLVSQVRTY